MQHWRAFLQFVVGGATVLGVSMLTNLKGPIGTQLGVLLSTLPVQDMLPVAFMETDKVPQYALENMVANVAVVAGMLVLSRATASWKLGKFAALGAGLGAWLVVSLLVIALARRFVDPT